MTIHFGRPLRAAAFVAAALVLAACGGGGGGGVTGGGGGGGGAASVSGDMIAYQSSRGWNYHGNAFGAPAVTMSVYADPPSGSTNALVLFVASGTTTTAFSGFKAAGLGVQNTPSGYTATAYVLLNPDGSIYSGSAIAGTPLFVPSTLTQGQTFSPYPGVSAVVQTVGTVPGASACPTPGTGATVQYTYLGQAYLVSYVPGCGITDYVGNHGEHLTLASVGTYSSLGTQSARRMSSLTILDGVQSLARVIATGARWSPFPGVR
jgi:hypothetical protein